MASPEFNLIEQFFTHATTQRDDVALGIGDDAAIVNVPPGQSLAIAVDTLISSVHFPKETPPKAIGHKALAVNLSDMAAMGAKPTWATLALTLPDNDSLWLKEFSQGFSDLAHQFGVQLIGGDTTRGSVLSITVQIFGLIKTDQGYLRSAAKTGDLIYVTGTLGDAGLALKHWQENLKPTTSEVQLLRQRLDCPEPRVAEALALQGLVHAAIDISDGLVADLSHILDRSQVGATLHTDKLPLSSSFKSFISKVDDLTLPLTAGDDYELILTIPQINQKRAQQIMRSFECDFTCIGAIEKQLGLRCLDGNKKIINIKQHGFDHFNET
ncbi:MAG: thiamine-phosphate kinase [Gammaproteobacteria bacterium]|nr:thiamine-phosphate kinase [Gammaproteobacteria bacterium]